MSSEKKLKILRLLDSGEITKEQATGLITKHVTKSEPEKSESFGAQAFDGVLRGLDYVDGYFRSVPFGIADLASEAMGGPDLMAMEDYKNVLKGKAPPTEEILDRAGMEDGWGKTLLGFAGDLGLSPSTWLTGGVGAAAKLGKFGKVLTAADDVVGAGLKGAGKLYKGATRKVIPKLGESFSGVDQNALKSYLRNPQRAEMVSEVGEDIIANDKLMGAWDMVQGAKKGAADAMNKEIRESGKMVDISNVKDKLQENITKMYQVDGLNGPEIDYLNGLKKLQNELFDLVDAKTGDVFKARDLVSSQAASRMKDSLSAMGDVIIDPATIKKSTDKRKLGTLRGMGAELSKSINDAIPNASVVKKNYSEILKDEKFLSENFKNTKKIDPKFDPDAFDKKGLKTLSSLNTSVGTGQARKVADFDTRYGTDLINDSNSIKASRQLVNPSWMPVSGQGVVSSGRIALSAAMGAAALNQAGGDTRTGAALGLGLGALLAGPKSLRRMSKMGHGAEKLIKPVLNNTPESVYKRMLINQNQEQ